MFIACYQTHQRRNFRALLLINALCMLFPQRTFAAVILDGKQRLTNWLHLWRRDDEGEGFAEPTKISHSHRSQLLLTARVIVVFSSTCRYSDNVSYRFREEYIIELCFLETEEQVNTVVVSENYGPTFALPKKAISAMYVCALWLQSKRQKAMWFNPSVILSSKMTSDTAPPSPPLPKPCWLQEDSRLWPATPKERRGPLTKPIYGIASVCFASASSYECTIRPLNLLRCRWNNVLVKSRDWWWRKPFGPGSASMVSPSAICASPGPPTIKIDVSLCPACGWNRWSSQDARNGRAWRIVRHGESAPNDGLRESHICSRWDHHHSSCIICTCYVTLKSHMESHVLKNGNFEPVVSDFNCWLTGKCPS